MKTIRKPKPAAAPVAPLSLDDLAGRSFAELDALYRAGKLPRSLKALDGQPKGRMLAVRAVGTALRRLAAARSFLWDGKSFTATSDDAGNGINRVQLPYLLGKQNLFPFTTLFGRSLLDGEQTIILDYDHAENPPFIRKIHDEIREVSPGIYLGPAMWKRASGAATVLWFALDATAR